MQKHVENYFLKVITGKKKGMIASFFKLFLWLLSWPYWMIISCRNWVFDRGWLRRYYPPVPVVMSIGNIVVGGTGKTPVTLMIAQEFYSEFMIAILSRGYRSQAERLSTPIVLSKGEGPMQSAFFCGDEPFLLAQNLPKACVIVGKDRHKASDMAAKAGAQLILLDDGMQHRRLARDFEIVVMDTCDPFGQGHFLPRGLLREGLSSLSRADLIILNHSNNNDKFLDLKQQLVGYTKAPIVGTKMEVDQIMDFGGEQISSLKGKKVGIFCGIAHPEYFYQTVVQQGGEIVDTAFTGDHRGFEPSALAAFARKCKEKGAEILVCTEKDKVKISDVVGIELPVAWLKMRLNLVEGHHEWQNFMDKVRGNLKKRI